MKLNEIKIKKKKTHNINLSKQIEEDIIVWEVSYKSLDAFLENPDGGSGIQGTTRIFYSKEEALEFAKDIQQGNIDKELVDMFYNTEKKIIFEGDI